jgi:hypothetical protein
MGPPSEPRQPRRAKKSALAPVSDEQDELVGGNGLPAEPATHLMTDNQLISKTARGKNDAIEIEGY